MRLTPAIPAFLLFLIIILASFSGNLFNRGFYYREFEKNNVQLDNRQDLLEEVFNGLRGGDMPSFNEKEQMHMQDVAGLVRNGTILLNLLAAVFALWISIHYYIHRDLAFLNRTLAYAGTMTIIFIALSILLAGQFEYLFIKFHQIFFNNDLWMLNPATDKLIVLFPQQFFVDYVASASIYMIIAAILLLTVFFISKRLNFK